MDMGDAAAHVLDIAGTINYTDRREPFIDERVGVSYSTGLRFYNWTDRDIYVKDRIGYPARVVSLKPHAHLTNDRRYCLSNDVFVVEYRFTVRYEDLDTARKYYNSLNGASEYIDQIRVQLNYAKNGEDLTVSIVTGVTMAQFKKAKGRLYFEELGITMELDGYQDSKHPESLEEIVKSRLNQTVLALADAKDDSIVVSIEGVDNTGEKTIGARYVSICNRVFKVPIRYEPKSRHHGIVIRYRPTVDEIKEGIDPTTIRVEEMSFEEAALKIGLSKTIEEAMVFGDSKAAAERKLSEAAYRIKELDQELAEQKRIHDREQMEHRAEMERERARFERERATREEEAAKRKHERDMSKMDKDQLREEARNMMDWMRLCGSILGFVGSVFMGFMKKSA